MKIYSSIRIGEFHPVFCEDFLIIEELIDNIWCFAVMDGCTMGKESQFASALLGKVLRKVIKEITYLDFQGTAPLKSQSLKEMGQLVITRAIEDVRKIKNQLFLEENELLTTINLVILDSLNKNAWGIIIGDGYWSMNDQIFEYDQNNKPDYLGYHLSEDPIQWFNNQSQMREFENIKSLCLATDGIAAFEKLDKSKGDFSKEVINYIFNDPEFGDSPNLLDKKIDKLINDYGYFPTDDLAIIRAEC